MTDYGDKLSDIIGEHINWRSFLRRDTEDPFNSPMAINQGAEFLIESLIEMMNKGPIEPDSFLRIELTLNGLLQAIEDLEDEQGQINLDTLDRFVHYVNMPPLQLQQSLGIQFKIPTLQDEAASIFRDYLQLPKEIPDETVRAEGFFARNTLVLNYLAISVNSIMAFSFTDLSDRIAVTVHPQPARQIDLTFIKLFNELAGVDSIEDWQDGQSDRYDELQAFDSLAESLVTEIAIETPPLPKLNRDIQHQSLWEMIHDPQLPFGHAHQQEIVSRLSR